MDKILKSFKELNENDRNEISKILSSDLSFLESFESEGTGSSILQKPKRIFNDSFIAQLLGVNRSRIGRWRKAQTNELPNTISFLKLRELRYLIESIDKEIFDIADHKLLLDFIQYIFINDNDFNELISLIITASRINFISDSEITNFDQKKESGLDNYSHFVIKNETIKLILAGTLVQKFYLSHKGGAIFKYSFLSEIKTSVGTDNKISIVIPSINYLSKASQIRKIRIESELTLDKIKEIVSSEKIYPKVIQLN